jgi:uncharacterized membrane protein
MTKMFMFIGIALGAIVLIAAVLAAIAPRKVDTQNKVTIHASKQVVYDQLRHLSRFPSWSPFLVADPKQKNWVTGTDGAVGATFHWDGVAEKSKGTQQIMSLVENSRVSLKCNITVPFVALPTFDYTIEAQKDGSVVVTQDFSTDLGVPGNIFGMLFGLKKQMNTTNQLGLDLLKKSIENNPLSAR